MAVISTLLQCLTPNTGGVLSELDGVYKSKIKQRKTGLKAFLSGQHVYTLLDWLWQDSFSLKL